MTIEEQTPMYDTQALLEEPVERLLYVYSYHSRWSTKPKPGCDNCSGTGTRRVDDVHLPGGDCHCIRNSVGGTFGAKEPRPFDDILEEHDMEKVLGQLRTPIDPATVWNFESEVRLLVRETWYLTWFNHSQPDWGDSDAEVLDRFQRYVFRIERFNEAWRYRTGDQYDPFCLMGAEDRWRWGGEKGDPPCRCEHCKKFGVVRIDH